MLIDNKLKIMKLNHCISVDYLKKQISFDKSAIIDLYHLKNEENDPFYDWFTEFLEKSYLWIKSKVWFMPLFFTIWNHIQDIHTTWFFTSKKQKIDSVLLVFDYPAELFQKEYYLIEDDYWHLVLNDIHSNFKGITRQIERWIFKPQWDLNKWVKFNNSKRWQWNVIGVIEKFEYKYLKEIIVPNQKIKKEIIKLNLIEKTNIFTLKEKNCLKSKLQTF